MLYWFLPHNSVNQLYVYIHALPLETPSHSPIPPLQVVTEHPASPVCYIAASHYYLFTHGNVYC